MAHMDTAGVRHAVRPISLGPMPGAVPGSMSSPINQDLHSKQTIDRLQCLQKHLKNPQTFERTIYELLEWCSDIRAFQSHFHQCLMNCLTVVSSVVGKPGFGIELCHRLFTICHEQLNKFPPNSARMLDTWYRKVQNMMLHSNMTSQQIPNSSPVVGNMMNHGMNYPPTHNHVPQRRLDHPGWNPQVQQGGGPPMGGPPIPNQHQSLSVITTATVWGLSTTQTPPVPVHSQSTSTSFAQQPMGHAGPHSLSNNMQANCNKSFEASNPKPNMGDPYRNHNMYPSGHRGMGPGRLQGPHMNSEQPHHPPAAAAAAAALAAAAAAATATATATFINGQQDQTQLNAYDQMPSRSMPRHMQDPGMHPGMPQDQQMMASGSPHHGMHSMMSQSYRVRGQMPSNIGRAVSVPANFPMGSPRALSHGPPMYDNGDPLYKTCRPQQSYNMGPYSGSPKIPNHFNKATEVPNHLPIHRQASGTPTAPGYSPRLPNSGPSPIHSDMSQHRYYSQQPQQSHSDQMGSYANPQVQRPQFPPQYPSEIRFSNCQASIPGNPTPPLTPGSAHNVPPYPTMTTVGMNDGKTGTAFDPSFPPYLPDATTTGHPPGQSGGEEMRLTFPVRDGIVLGPFQLEHNLASSTHAFHLRDKVFTTLMERPDLDLQFKCYHHDDSMKYTNWPFSVAVSVNSTPLNIPRSADRMAHLPLYLKRLCTQGRNSIEISVTDCCCSHSFLLQLVHRPSVLFAMKGLMYKRILPEIHCRSRINRHFANGAISANNNIMTNGSTNDMPTTVRMSLRCPITNRRLRIPARGQDCKHIQCFDLEAYLQFNSGNGTWRCPVCHKGALLEYLQVDEYIQNILRALNDRDCDHVSIDANCNWAMLPVTSKPEPFSRNMQGPGDGHWPNGAIKQDNFTGGFTNVKQEPMGSQRSFGIVQEPYMSALSIKQEPNKHRNDFPIKMDPDGPPLKKCKNGPSPGTNLNNRPAPSPGSSMGHHKMSTGSPSSVYPQSYNPCGNMTSSTSGPHPGGGFLRSGPAVSFNADMSDRIAANDMVPIEKRLNPAISAWANNGSPGLSGRRCMGGNPKTPQGPSTPLRPPSSSALTPQSIGGVSNTCSTPSSVNSSYNAGAPMSVPPSNTCSTPGANNPSTPVVTLPNCDALDTALLDSLLSDADAVLPGGDDLTSLDLGFDPTADMQAGAGDNIASLELPDNELMDNLDMFPLNEDANNVNNHDDISTLFDAGS